MLTIQRRRVRISRNRRLILWLALSVDISSELLVDSLIVKRNPFDLISGSQPTPLASQTISKSLFLLLALRTLSAYSSQRSPLCLYFAYVIQHFHGHKYTNFFVIVQNFLERAVVVCREWVIVFYCRWRDIIVKLRRNRRELVHERLLHRFVLPPANDMLCHTVLESSTLHLVIHSHKVVNDTKLAVFRNLPEHCRTACTPKLFLTEELPARGLEILALHDAGEEHCRQCLSSPPFRLSTPSSRRNSPFSGDTQEEHGCSSISHNP